MDEDVYLEENLIQEDEEALILRDIEERQALTSRISKWARPPLSHEYTSQSKNVGQWLCSLFTAFLGLYGGTREIWWFWHLLSLYWFQFFSNWRLITWLGRLISNCCPTVLVLLRSSGSLGSQRKVTTKAFIYSNCFLVALVLLYSLSLFIFLKLVLCNYDLVLLRLPFSGYGGILSWMHEVGQQMPSYTLCRSLSGLKCTHLWCTSSTWEFRMHFLAVVI